MTLTVAKALLSRSSWRPAVFASARGLLAVVALLPLWSFVSFEASLLAKAIVVAFLVAGALRPAAALAGCAAAAPLGRVLGPALGSPVGLSEPVVLAFLAGWLLHRAVLPAPASGRWTTPGLRPVAVFALVVVASCVVQLIVLHVFVDYPWPYLRRLVSLWVTDSFRNPSFLRPLVDGLFVLEGCGLFWAVVALSRRDPELPLQLVRLTVLAAAAVAALSLLRLLATSLAKEGSTLTLLFDSLRTRRFAAGFADFNAAGSTLAMALVLSVGLVSQAKRTAAGWLLVAALILGGLWLSASRVAVVTGPVVLACVAGRRLVFRHQRGEPRRALLGAVLAVALLSAVLAPLYVSRPVLAEFGGRFEMAKAAMRMTATAPVFGIGLGRFYDLSSRFIGSPLAHIPRENAHNNFLQVLAELGAVGLAAFLAVLWLPLRSAVRALSGGSADTRLAWAAGGVAAFLVTCLTGHPLLVFEAASAFWVALGATAALAAAHGGPEADEGGTGRRRRSVLAWLVVAAVACSVPLRAGRLLANTDLSRAGMGLSSERVDREGVRFRWMLRQARVYVRAGTRGVVLPLKLPSGVADAFVFVGGRKVATVTINGARWREARFALPRSSGEAFVPVDVRLGPLHQRPDEEGGGTLGAARVQVGWPRVAE